MTENPEKIETIEVQPEKKELPPAIVPKLDDDEPKKKWKREYNELKLKFDRILGENELLITEISALKKVKISQETSKSVKKPPARERKTKGIFTVECCYNCSHSTAAGNLCPRMKIITDNDDCCSKYTR